MDFIGSIQVDHMAEQVQACKAQVCIQMFSWELNLLQVTKLDSRFTFLIQNYQFKEVKHIQ